MKFLQENLIYIVLIIGSLIALGLPTLRRPGNSLSVLRATQLINQGAKTLVLDVRDVARFAEGRIAGARNIPLKELATRTAELEKFRQRKVIVVCEAGHRAGAASAVLKKAGFAEVFSLDGGMRAWKTQGLLVVRGDAA